MLSGKSTYRSRPNDRPPIGDHPQKALALIFGAGVFDFVEPGPNGFARTIDMDGAYCPSNRAPQAPASFIAVARAAA